MLMRPDHLASVMHVQRVEQTQGLAPRARRWRWIAGHRFVDDQTRR